MKNVHPGDPYETPFGAGTVKSVRGNAYRWAIRVTLDDGQEVMVRQTIMLSGARVSPDLEKLIRRLDAHFENDYGGDLVFCIMDALTGPSPRRDLWSEGDEEAIR